MADMEKVIKEFAGFCDRFHPACTSEERDKEVLTATLELLQQFRWIPVSERMPDEYEAVEIWLKYDKYSCTAYWCNGKGGFHWTEVGTDGEKEFAKYEVSHWRKPKPPKEG